MITAALLLTALLFVFGVEQRSAEIGTLLAVGFPPSRVRRLFFGEAALLALLGTVVGTALGVQYTKAVLRGLSSVWSGAVGSTTILYHSTTLTVVGGALGAWLVALGATYWALRGQVRHTALELMMSSEGVAPQAPAAALRRVPVSLWIAGVSGLAAVGVGLFADPSRGRFPESFLSRAVLRLFTSDCFSGLEASVARWMICFLSRGVKRKVRLPCGVFKITVLI